MPPLPGWLQIALVAFSVVMFAGTLIGIPYLIVRLPPDHFVRTPARRSPVIHVLRNMLGVVLVLLGIAMLVLPGQGVITILVGLSILDLPMKTRLIYRILSRPTVKDAIQKLRNRAGKPPLLLPEVE
jgi:hypothetical protein